MLVFVPHFLLVSVPLSGSRKFNSLVACERDLEEKHSLNVLNAILYKNKKKKNQRGRAREVINGGSDEIKLILEGHRRNLKLVEFYLITGLRLKIATDMNTKYLSRVNLQNIHCCQGLLLPK